MVSLEDVSAFVADDVVVFLLLIVLLLFGFLPYPDGLVIGRTCQPSIERGFPLPLLAIGRPATSSNDIGVALQYTEQPVFVFVVLLLLDEDGIHCPNHDVGI